MCPQAPVPEFDSPALDLESDASGWPASARRHRDRRVHSWLPLLQLYTTSRRPNCPITSAENFFASSDEHRVVSCAGVETGGGCALAFAQPERTSPRRFNAGQPHHRSVEVHSILDHEALVSSLVASSASGFESLNRDGPSSWVILEGSFDLCQGLDELIADTQDNCAVEE